MGGGSDSRIAVPGCNLPSRSLPGRTRDNYHADKREIRMGELAMAKKPLPSTMEPVNAGKQPPFVPLVHKVTVAPLPSGTYQEAGLFLKLYDYAYAGLNQTGTINIKIPKPV